MGLVIASLIVVAFTVLLAYAFGRVDSTHDAWNAGFARGQAAWQANESLTRERDERVTIRESQLDARHKSLDDYYATLVDLDADLKQRAAHLELAEKRIAECCKPVCIPSVYEQLQTPCLN